LQQTSKFRTHRITLSVLAVLAAAIPYLAFRHSGMGLFEIFWEFASYRYFEAINYFEQTTLPYWVVQGIPMTLIQTVLMKGFLHFDRASLGTPNQIEQFSQATVLIAYILIAIALVVAVNLKRMQNRDAFLLVASVFALFPMTRWYFYFFAPDYWIFELPFAIVSTALAVIALRTTTDDTPLPPIWLVVLAGCWMALCFTQKPSLAGLGSLAILFRIALPTGRPIGKAFRIALLIPAFLVMHRLIMFASNHFSWAQTKLASHNYWAFLRGGASTGTSLMDYVPLLRTLWFLVAPIVLGIVFLVASLILCFVEGQRQRTLIVSTLLAGLALAHCLVIHTRPSGTSVVDFTIYGAMLIPITIAFLPERTVYQRLGFAGLLAAVLVAVPNVLPVPSPQTDFMARVNEAGDYVRSLGRPVSVIVHDNRAHPLTIEAFALFTGQLQPLQPGTPRNLRQQFLRGADLLTTNDQIKAAIAAGRTIIWGSAPIAPRIEDVYPSITALEADPRKVERVIDISPGAHTAHIAYLRDEGSSDELSRFNNVK
jgi:hypothetical protein